MQKDDMQMDIVQNDDIQMDIVQEDDMRTDTAKEVNRKIKKPKKKKRFTIPIICLILGFVIGGLFSQSAIDLILKNNDGVDLDYAEKKIYTIENLLKSKYLDELDSKQMESYIYKGLMAGIGDDYAAYYTKEEYEQMTEDDSGEYKGVGILVNKDADTGYIYINDVMKDCSEYGKGIKQGDMITKIKGEDVREMDLDKAVSIMRDPSEDTVTITILRDDKESDITVEKRNIVYETVEYSMKEDKIGYIEISQFIENTPQQFEEAINDLEKQGMKKLIIDLRDNGGGYLESCTEMLSLIVPKGELLVYTLDKDQNKEELNSNNDRVLDIPIVVLVNGNSASASEIMTGCLKDYGLATVIGSTTYGKGIVQGLYTMTDGSAVKFTISKYYTPKGNDIHKKGIEPDIVVEMTADEWKAALEDSQKDTQLKEALKYLKKQN